MRHEVLVLGGGYAGLLTALRLSRRLRGCARITLASASEVFAERIRQHQVAAGAELRRHSLHHLLSGSGVLFVPAQVEAIDLQRGELRAGSQRLGFEELVLALGSRVDVSRLPGAREHALTLDVDQAPLLRERLSCAVRDGSRVVVCGGGLSGIELSAELCERWPGLPLTLLTAGELGPGLSQRARAYLRRFFAQRGVQLREGLRVERIEPGGVWCSDEVETSARSRRLAAELTVWAGGFVGSELPRRAGLDVNLREQVRVDSALRSLSHRNVTAVGDAAALQGSTTGRLQLSCKVALPMAIAAADNLARRLTGIPEQPFEFRDTGVCISLGRRDGVIDLRHPDSSVREQIISGRWGALLKEAVCGFTVRRMHWERRAFWPAGSLSVAGRISTRERPQIAS
jgi:NADH:ubiquinone reductase (H+-translocating)